MAQDPSHVRSLTEREWERLLTDAGFAVRARERFAKRHVFADWTARANLPEERRDELARILLDAGERVAGLFKLTAASSRSPA